MERKKKMQQSNLLVQILVNQLINQQRIKDKGASKDLTE